jgi:hypothetical protein
LFFQLIEYRTEAGWTFWMRSTRIVKQKTIIREKRGIHWYAVIAYKVRPIGRTRKRTTEKVT